QHVAGKELALGRHLAATPHLDDFLLRYQHLLEQVRQSLGSRLLTDRLCNLVLEVRVGMHDVPAFRHVVAAASVSSTGRSRARISPSLPGPGRRPERTPTPGQP